MLTLLVWGPICVITKPSMYIHGDYEKILYKYQEKMVPIITNIIHT